MSRLVQGGEVLTAVEASALRAEELGYDEALVELGFEPSQLRIACMRDAAAWLRHLRVSPTLGEVHDVLGSAELVGITAGVRLGRMFPAPTAPELLRDETVRELSDVAETLRSMARAAEQVGLADLLEELAERIEAVATGGPLT